MSETPIVWHDEAETMRTRDGKRSTYDAQEGEVAAWARRLVREGLIERVPWLRLTTEENA